MTTATEYAHAVLSTHKTTDEIIMPDSKLRSDLGIDSLTRVMVLVDLEAATGLPFNDDDAADWYLAGDVIRTVEAKMKEAR